MDDVSWLRVFWATIGGVFMGVLALATTWFAEPPPTSRQLWRVIIIDIGLGIPGAVAAGYALSEPVAAFLNGLSAKLIAGYAAVDDKAAALLVGCVVIKLLPIVVDLAANKLKAWSKMEAKAS